MKKILIKSLIFFIFFNIFCISQVKNENIAEILQSFRPRVILLNNFLKKCEENKISLLLIEDKMGNKSKMTRFTTYKTSIIYISRYGKKRLTYLFNFKDDTLFTVKTY
ncbi:MAG TPA: hypothetical protein VIR55_14640 [Ignavibacteria bacterium]